MAEDSQNPDNNITSYKDTSPAPVTTRHGQPVYAVNPSIPDAGDIGKPRRTRIGTDKKGVVVDNGSGEILGHGGALIYEWEEVDSERFVKLYLAGLRSAVGMSKAGLMVFNLIYNRLRDAKDRDLVALSAMDAQMPQRTYNRGLRELLERGFLFRSPNPGLYWVNIRYMFNGDRLAFVKGYKLKKDDRQLDLLDDTASQS